MLVLVSVCAALGWVGDAPLEPRNGGHPGGSAGWAWLFLALLVSAFVLYLVALRLLRRGGPLRAVAILAAAIQLAPLASPLLLSTDAWAYWSYARLDNPYVQTPSDDPVSASYVGTAWLDTTSVYGPAFTLAAKPAGVTESADVAAWAFKAAAAAAILAAALLAARLSRRPTFALAFVGWNPLLAVHFAGGGHNDAWMAALLVGAVGAAAANRRQLAGASWALAALVKWVGVIFLPLRLLEARATGRPVRHLGFAAAAVGVAGLATWAFGLHWLDPFGPLARNASRETSYALPHRLGVPLAGAIAAFALGYAWLVREAWRGRARLGLAAVAALATTPYLAPWYTAWALPLAAAEDDRTAQLLALAFCAYLLPQTVPL